MLVAKLKLTVIKDGVLLDDREYLLNGATTLGRSDSCSIRIDLPGISRCHCTVVRLSYKKSKKVEYSLIDGCYQDNRTLKKSTNGILLNNEIVESSYLKNGDEIILIDKVINGVKQFARAIYCIEDLDSNNGLSTQY